MDRREVNLAIFVDPKKAFDYRYNPSHHLVRLLAKLQKFSVTGITGDYSGPYRVSKKKTQQIKEILIQAVSN